jgi:hypothetical protein
MNQKIDEVLGVKNADNMVYPKGYAKSVLPSTTHNQHS